MSNQTNLEPVLEIMHKARDKNATLFVTVEMLRRCYLVNGKIGTNNRSQMLTQASHYRLTTLSQ